MPDHDIEAPRIPGDRRRLAATVTGHLDRDQGFHAALVGHDEHTGLVVATVDRTRGA